MKKKLYSIGVITALCVTSMALFTGCDKKAYDYELSEYVKVGEYKGLEYEKVTVSVSQKEIEAEIDNRLTAATTTEDKKTGTVKDGDTINISYEGKIDGKTFDGGSADNKSITIGSTSMIDGFTEGLIGKKVGKTVKLDLKFPDDYQSEDLAGKDVVFEITINTKQVKTVPEYDVDFIKANSEFDNKKDYEKSVKESLLEEKEAEEDTALKNKLWEAIIEKSEAKKYPEEELAAKEEKLISTYTKVAEQNRMEYKDFIEQIGYTEETWAELMKETAESTVFQEMVLYSIARTENIEITDDEYDDYLADLLERVGMTAKQYADSNNGVTIEEWGEQEEVRVGLLLNKVLDKVVEYGKAK
ncbi:trigger factor [Clostridiales Family XIII bacterium PM5-7]